MKTSDKKYVKLKKSNSIDLPSDVIDVLLKTSQAYQGVGDFEGTGENMTTVIGDVRKILTKYGIDWKQY
jgi:hypothetical protein